MPPQKKKQKPVHRPDPFLAWLQHVGLSIGYGVLFMFLVANIILSQYVPDTYFALMNTKTGALSTFFNRARDIPSYAPIFPEMRDTLIAHEDEIFIESDQRQLDIAELQQVLQLNPQSRDVLYALSQLYEQEGQYEKAAELLKQAQAIDPQLLITPTPR